MQPDGKYKLHPPKGDSYDPHPGMPAPHGTTRVVVTVTLGGFHNSYQSDYYGCEGEDVAQCVEVPAVSKCLSVLWVITIYFGMKVT